MWTKILFLLTTLSILAISIISGIALPAPLKSWIAGSGIISLVLLGLLYRSVIKPGIIARRGLDLLNAQDFNNRLVKVGEPEADRIVSLFNDLMGKLKNERLRIREQDSFLRLLIDASPMGILLLNLEGDITMINPAFKKISGIEPDEDIIGYKLTDVKSEITNALCGLAQGESRILRLDGSRLYNCYHLTFLQEGFRRHFYLVESLTEEVRIAEKEAYEKVIRMISHEVNNSMGSLQSVLEILAEDSEDDPEMKETIESCLERSERMCEFINAFAELARIPEPRTTIVNLDEELMRVIPFLRLIAPEKVELKFNTAPAMATIPEKDRKMVSIDRSLMQQVIVNIVKNAVESINSSGETAGNITLETIKDTSGVTLCISNNGEHISDETASHLFTPFFSTKRSGRGLGLTLVSEVLRKHNCLYSLRTYPDGLTRFLIRFPAP